MGNLMKNFVNKVSLVKGINNIKASTNEDLQRAVINSEGKTINLTIERNGNILQKKCSYH